MKLKNLLALMLLSLFPIVSQAQATSTPQPADNSTYTEDKTNIVVTPDKPEFTIKLKSNPTTGYSWFLRDYDTDLITPVKHNYVAGTPGLIGASGYELWVFKAKPSAFVVPQQTSLRMFYARPWESSDTGTMLVFRITMKAN